MRHLGEKISNTSGDVLGEIRRGAVTSRPLGRGFLFGTNRGGSLVDATVRSSLFVLANLTGALGIN